MAKLFDQRYLADRGSCLRRHPPCRFAAMGAGELGADPDQGGGEVHVFPGQPEELGDPQAAEEGSSDQQAPAGWTGGEQALDLGAAEHPLATSPVARALLGFEQLDRIDDDPAAAASEAQDALQDGEGVGGALRRATSGAQLTDQSGDVLDPERSDPPMAEAGEDVVVKVEAVRLICTGVAIAGRHHRLEALAPAAGNGVEAQVRRGRHPARL